MIGQVSNACLLSGDGRSTAQGIRADSFSELAIRPPPAAHFPGVAVSGSRVSTIGTCTRAKFKWAREPDRILKILLVLDVVLFGAVKRNST